MAKTYHKSFPKSVYFKQIKQLTKELRAKGLTWARTFSEPRFKTGYRTKLWMAGPENSKKIVAYIIAKYPQFEVKINGPGTNCPSWRYSRSYDVYITPKNWDTDFKLSKTTSEKQPGTQPTEYEVVILKRVSGHYPEEVFDYDEFMASFDISAEIAGVQRKPGVYGNGYFEVRERIKRVPCLKTYILESIDGAVCRVSSSCGNSIIFQKGGKELYRFDCIDNALHIGLQWFKDSGYTAREFVTMFQSIFSVKRFGSL